MGVKKMPNQAYLVPLAADIITVAVLILFALRGRKRGLLRTVAGILVLIIAYFGAGQLSELTTPYLSKNYVEPRIRDYIMPKSQEAADTAVGGISETISQMLLKIGIPQNAVTEAVGNFDWSTDEKINGAIDGISGAIAQKVTFAVSCLLYFILLLILLSLLVRLVNLITKIPGLNFINKTGGLILGLLLGYITLTITVTILTNTGILLSKDIVDKTVILRNISGFNPFFLIYK
jgi:uncharacterized membrane protein required for colicin V production